MLIFFQDIAKGVTGEFQSVEQFSKKLRPFLNSDSKINQICAELGVTDKNLQDPNTLLLLKEAMSIANLGTCIDETSFAASLIRQGATKGKINQELKKNHVMMQLIHGLLQGPYQSKFGYETYNMPELKNLHSKTFMYDDPNSQKELVEYLKNNSGLLVVTIVGKHLHGGEGESNHVIVARTSSDGNSLDVLDSGRWKENLSTQ